MPAGMQDTSNLSSSIRTKYANKYIEAADYSRVYDRYAAPIGKEGVEQASFLANAVQVNFLSDMAIGTSTVSEAIDVVPQSLREATATISPTSRWGALQWSELIDLKAYTNYGEQRMKLLGKNQAETVDLLAQAQALQGGFLQRAAARNSLDAGTTGHRLTDTVFSIIDAKLQSAKCPAYVDGSRSMYFATMHPYAFHDIRLGGNVVSVAQYQDKGIILNFELGQVGPFKLIVTPWAKVFWGAGAANASAIETTLAASATANLALAKTIEVADATNIDQGDSLLVGTHETGNTHYETNERVVVQSVSGTTITIIGEGANGGLRFDHAVGEAVSNDDSVFPVVFGGPASLAKLYDSGVGEYGTIVGPKLDGIVDQFATVGWKWYGNYGRWVESWLIRGEFASSLEA